ncbi:DNA-binding protein rif1 [Desmophyllum pertusum]|uniref:DNA-binding protein rif1 n=1 Tax=Desmophyllum pertusum TaxID=174260 RepID=A0A9W9ZZI0_9CNID|nr:DNA-binding protein rif1 [Desmophyllum pertusum]
MVTIPECEGLFEPLLRVLEDNMAAGDDQVDAYLRLTDRLREEEDVFVKELLNFLTRVVVVFKRDIESDKSDLCQASLQALGHCLYQEQIASSICPPDGQDLVQGLLSRIQESEDKGVCTRALWCLAKQNLDSGIINTKLESILITLESVITKDLQSVTVDHEALSVIERLLQQLPKSEMIKSVEYWAKLVFPLLVSSAIKVRERALAVLSAGLEHMMSAQEKVVKILVPLLKGCLLKEFPKMCSERKELFVLKCWCCIVPVLGETLHRGGSLINDLLKLVEQGFRDPSTEVQVMSFSAWNILIDNFALSSDVLCSPRRVKLIMTPLRNLAVKERNEAVEGVRLSTWWHFVCLLGSRVQELFDQVCTPLLQFIFGTAIDQISSLKTKEGLSDLKCPPTPTNSKLMSDMMAETPKSNIRRSLKDMGTPRTPTVLNASFAKTAKQKLLAQGCEILLEILKIDDQEIDGNSGLIVSLAERLHTVIFKRPEDFKKYASLLTSATREGFKALGIDLVEPLGVKVWSLLVTRISKLLEKGPSSDYGEMLLPLLAVMQDFVDSNLLAPTLVLKMLGELSSLPAEVLSHHMASLHSKDNPQGSPALLLVQLLFTPHLLANIWQNERFHLAFEHLVDYGMTAASGQLFFLQTVLNLLVKASSVVTSKDGLWRLWNCVVDHLNAHIQKTNDVNQGDALEHDFSTLYLALTFPVKHVLDTSLPQGVGKEVSKTLAELYRSFSRAAALVSTAEANVCCEELCTKILSVDDDWKAKDVAFVDTLVSFVGVVIECLDFSTSGLFAMATTAAGKSPNTTPTKWNKRLQRPMGNFTSMVTMVAKLLSACERTSDCKDSTQTLGILTAVLTNLIDKLSYLFVHVNGAVTITAVLKTLALLFIKITETTLDKRLFTARLIQKIEKLWTDMLTCVQSRHCGPYNSDLLAVMSPLLEVTLGHPKRSIKNHAVMFWNATFARSQTLKYPENLRPALQVAKDKMSLTLPGWENIEISVKETQLDLESEELTQNTNLVKPLPYGILGSPQRRKQMAISGGSPQLKGSFLHKAVSAEKAVENASPKRISRSPKLGRPRNSPASMHVRRKLPLSKYEDDDQEYVMIAPSPKKKRVLTEHQKEIMRSRSDVPALYNALDQSQDCTQFSQFTLTSQANITPDTTPTSTPEEEKDLNLVCNNKEDEVTLEKTKEVNADSVLSGLEKNEVKDSDEIEKEIVEKIEETVEGVKTVNSDMEVVEIMECDVVEILDCGENEDDTSASVKTAETDVMDVQDEMQSGDDESEVTSPDVIPSSQTPSFESPFQSLRRVMIPLESILPRSLETRRNKGRRRQLEKTDTKMQSKEVETQRAEPSDVMETNEADESSPEKQDEPPTTKTKVSPVAGRTRRKLQTKTTVDNTPSREEPEDEPAEQEVSRLLHKEKNSEKTEKESNAPTTMEKPAELTLAGVARDATSSPVLSAKNKFLRPFSAGGSPCRVTLRGRNSPGVSPTTGILKRWPGNKQAVDSPSPPGKVRRVSFALPVKDDSCEEPRKNPLKQIPLRRPVPVSSNHGTQDSTECMFPDLVSCTVPVEQILPSILTMSWSRGMGHLVRAQNIHTIGNLSALKEEQVRNLPIKSPKVATLKKALRRFHQSQRGRNSKPLATKLTIPEPSLKEDSDNKQEIVTSSEHAQLPSEANVVKEPISVEDSHGMKLKRRLATNEPQIVFVADEDCGTTEGEPAVQINEGSGEGKEEESVSPTRPAHDSDAIEVTADMSTPQRETCVQPTKLFSGEKSGLQCMEVDEMLSAHEEEVEAVKEVLPEELNEDSKQNKLVDSPLEVEAISEQSTELPSTADAESGLNIEDKDRSDRETFCGCLRSLKDLASPDVLRDLSSEEIFEAHHNLTEIMSVVVQALKGRWQSPRSEK